MPVKELSKYTVSYKKSDIHTRPKEKLKNGMGLPSDLPPLAGNRYSSWFCFTLNVIDMFSDGVK
jgi:hypothetical protein